MENKEKVPDVKHEGWNIKNIADEATNESPDDILRKTLREDDDKKKADEQDVVESIDSDETPQGKEENKKLEGDRK